MKINAAFAKSLLLIASFGLVMPLFAKPPVKSAPAAAKQEEVAKAEGDEAEPVIPGTVYKRKDGSFLSITIENNCFKLAFYDEKKKQMPADVARASIRWSPKNKKGDERRILNPSGDGLTLVSPPPVQPPYAFHIYVTLLNDKDEAIDGFNTDYHN